LRPSSRCTPAHRQNPSYAARSALKATLLGLYRNGYDIARSAIYAALHQPGVLHVNIISPVTDIDITDTQDALFRAAAAL